MSIKPISFKLSDKTINLISESTRLTPKELKIDILILFLMINKG